MSQYSDQCKCGVCDEVRRLRAENSELRGMLTRISIMTQELYNKAVAERCNADMLIKGLYCELPKHHAGVHRCGQAKLEPPISELNVRAPKCGVYAGGLSLFCELPVNHLGRHRCCQVQW